MANIFITIASILLLVAYIIGLLAKKYPWLYAVAKWVAYAAMACAAVATMMGMLIIAYGQMLQGGIYTVVGALLTYLSYVAADGYAAAANAQIASEEAAKKAAQEAAKHFVVT